MRNLLFLVLGILLMSSCNKEDVLDIPDNNQKASGIRFSGVKRSPQTKGVAQLNNMWRSGSNITIKFLDGTAEMQESVKDYAKEWLDYANIKFKYVTSGDALVRISFDNESNRYVTWSYTGTDCKMVANQLLPTASFDSYQYLNEDEKKADVLRLFGQILGLELEHRHLDVNPKWRPALENYWNGNIMDIPWETLKKYVYDPLLKDDVIQTEEFDNESIMLWAFPPNCTLNSDMKYSNFELSEMDKEFIGKLYPFNEEVVIEGDPTILTFDFTRDTTINFSKILKSTNLKVDLANGTVLEGRSSELPTVAYTAGVHKVMIWADYLAIEFDFSFDYVKNVPSGYGLVECHLSSKTKFEDLVFQCTPLKKVTYDVVPDLTEITVLNATFFFTELEEVPDKFLANAPNLEYVSILFSDSKVKVIPEDLIKYNTKLKGFGATFFNCPITSIPENLFANNPSVFTIVSSFGSTNITSIPENLFANLKLQRVNLAFQFCRKLKSVPNKLFANSPNIVDMVGTFQYCPITSCPKYWEIYPGADGRNCYTGSGGLSYYSEIPANWK